MASVVNKALPLPGGAEIPMVGLGTFTVFGQTGKPEETEEAVKAAIDIGYRHIDCAWVYGNEENVGNALDAKITDGTVKREDLFITTKLWNIHHNPVLVRKALEDSLKKLKISYVDMFLIHWPTALKDGGFSYDESFPKDSDGKLIFARYKHEDVWKAVEECQRAGLAKNIGLSNFNRKQMIHVLDNCTIKPANVQIEISPYFSNKQMVDFCKERGIVVTAYAPLGAPFRPWRAEGEPNTFEEPLLKTIAEAKGKTVAQVVLRYHLQNGIVVIPKSLRPARLKENLSVFDFELSDDEMTQIATLNRDLRVYKEPVTYGHPDHPFENEPF